MRYTCLNCGYRTFTEITVSCSEECPRCKNNTWVNSEKEGAELATLRHNNETGSPYPWIPGAFKPWPV